MTKLPKVNRTTQAPPALGDLLTERQVAERLGLPRTTLTDWRFRGRGPAWIKVGRLVRYPTSLLERWLAEHLHNESAA